MIERRLRMKQNRSRSFDAAGLFWSSTRASSPCQSSSIPSRSSLFNSARTDIITSRGLASRAIVIKQDSEPGISINVGTRSQPMRSASPLFCKRSSRSVNSSTRSSGEGWSSINILFINCIYIGGSPLGGASLTISTIGFLATSILMVLDVRLFCGEGGRRRRR